jgi:hypothetical protein
MNDNCCFCNGHVDLDDEGVIHPNGDCAHDVCADSREWVSANEGDFND